MHFLFIEECTFCNRDAGSQVSLTVATRKTAELLSKLDVEITDQLLDCWPPKELLKIPDFDNSALDFLKKVAVMEVLQEAVEEKIEEEIEVIVVSK